MLGLATFRDLPKELDDVLRLAQEELRLARGRKDLQNGNGCPTPRLKEFLSSPGLLVDLDELKIDRSFLKDVPNNTDDSAIVGAIIAMAHGLGMGVVAEGIEKQEQLEFLRDRDCDEYQGFLASKPLLASDFKALVAKNMKAFSQM